VIYAGIERGVKEGFDVIICDTAGRLHTKANLLDELRKMNRVASKVIDTAPHETILVLDANTGQNAIQQAKLFKEAVDISGIVLTKLDGTAKGGVILGICEELDSPIRFIGIGESVTDLREFKADEFVEALFM
jgi:fused signal recognition particle receptor